MAPAIPRVSDFMLRISHFRSLRFRSYVLSLLSCVFPQFFQKIRRIPLDFSTPFFGLEMRVLKKYPKNPQFRPISAQFLSKSHQNARKIVNIRKSLCHHLNLLSQKHLTPFFSESPISPRVHSLPQESAFFAQKRRFTPDNRTFHPPPHPTIRVFRSKITVSPAYPAQFSRPKNSAHPPQNPPQIPARPDSCLSPYNVSAHPD